MKSLLTLLVLVVSLPAFSGTRIGDAKEGYVCSLDETNFAAMKALAKKLGAKSISLEGSFETEYTAHGKQWQKMFFTFVNAEGELVFADYILDLDTCSQSSIGYTVSQQFDIK